VSQKCVAARTSPPIDTVKCAALCRDPTPKSTSLDGTLCTLRFTRNEKCLRTGIDCATTIPSLWDAAAAMDAFLGASSNNFACDSVADLTAELQNQLAAKVKPSRCEHISVTFELRSTIVFEVNASDPENEALEDANNIDPLLGGARSASAAPAHVAAANNGANVRRISANDTLMDQPMNDPVTQTAVAKHLVSLVGSVDNSLWTVRAVSRASQGWIFKYLCKDSWQSWTRQTAKHPPKTVVGEWSNKDGQDPINMSTLCMAARMAALILTTSRSACLRLPGPDDNRVPAVQPHDQHQVRAYLLALDGVLSDRHLGTPTATTSF
jgi:hypothetical protein